MNNTYTELYRYKENICYSPNDTWSDMDDIIDDDTLDKYFTMYMHLHIASIQCNRKHRTFFDFVNGEHSICLNNIQTIKMEWYQLFADQQ